MDVGGARFCCGFVRMSPSSLLAGLSVLQHSIAAKEGEKECV